uniref:Uncharacterized protein n=1 Tax=uncultured marine virus TaxID=186617 RepID=A0A0F7L7Z8_9VIRU|nr:hypothetical protein [uncultured marine virus]
MDRLGCLLPICSVLQFGQVAPKDLLTEDAFQCIARLKQDPLIHHAIGFIGHE